MKISGDYDRCEGHGLCAEQAPAVFSLNHDAELNYRFEGTEVPAEQAESARGAATSCPVAALRVLP
ncbi:ferredoxin [Lipingzhangella halophila]|uniref:Ferredoxin n=1 Tax=Lipingzhangella halophila TaxID=1783352 RepID=A0A7W7W164_9ACTN|nr:ferredoxin [Lipingzhangella halophila]MBB4930612.1 ferredoxin [Lipingzhangella halophila]